MTDRRHGFDVEDTLRDVGARLAYPRTADLVPAVLSRIEGARARPSLLDLFRSPLSLAPALATLLLLVLATLAFQPVASTAAEALGLRGIGLFRVPGIALFSPGQVLPADVRQVGSVEAASSEVGFTVRAPERLGPPDAVFARTTGDAALAILVYGERGGIPVSSSTGVAVLITEVRGSLETQLLGKTLPPGTKVEELEVNGGRGVWIEGEPHQFFYRAPSGEILTETVRLAGNVLLWEQGGVLMRIEAQVDREQALRIARSMR